jgi:hypothetical protein
MYIDPGSGSFIIQALIATLVAVPFFLRHQIRRAVQSVRQLGRRPDATARPDDPDANA